MKVKKSFKIVEDIKAGLSLSELVIKYNVDRTYIYKIAEQYKLTIVLGERYVISPLHEELGRIFRVLRAEKNETKQNVSKQTNLTVNRISMIESGTYDIPLSVLKRLAEFYNKDLREIFAGV